MSIALKLESKVIDDLIAYYKIDEAVAKEIYDETMVLYHRLCTITDFNELNTVNDRVLFALINVIGHYYNFTESTRFLFSVIMFIVITGRKSDAEYMFMQWLSLSAQDKNIDNGLDVFIYSLKALHEHFEREKVQSFEPFNDLLKVLNRNIILLQEEVIKNGTHAQRNIINEDESNDDDDDDDDERNHDDDDDNDERNHDGDDDDERNNDDDDDERNNDGGKDGI
ncbi:unnamed protein product [Rotaria sordida]|uniref:Uncharacterized protein n=1 Tax=Rotaria sordida TaxID=392033 RepID=A0A819HB29_9BILA|nr:unnamed protein product [Rotaria sordida]CAF3895324.1 unnamed protein product [Rotaria sordida]